MECIAGQAGVAGHCTIGDGVMITAQSGTHGDIPDGSMVSGSPAFDHKQWLRAIRIFNRLPELAKAVRPLPPKQRRCASGEQRRRKRRPPGPQIAPRLQDFLPDKPKLPIRAELLLTAQMSEHSLQSEIGHGYLGPQAVAVQPIRVLLLDDHEENLVLRSAILRQKGYRVVTSSSIEEAEAKLQDIDIAVLDYHLGSGKFGTDVADTLRRKRPQVPIIILSATLERRFGGIADMHLLKGYSSVDDLVSALAFL